MNNVAHEGNRVKHPMTGEIGLVVRTFRDGVAEWVSVRFDKGLQSWPAKHVKVVG